MFRHYCVFLRELVVRTLLRQISMSIQSLVIIIIIIIILLLLLTDKLYCSYMFRHYCVFLRELVVSTLLR